MRARKFADWCENIYKILKYDVWTLVKNSNSFQLLDVMQFMGAATARPPQGYYRVIWFLLVILSWFVFCMLMINAFQTFSGENSFSASIWHIVIAVAVVMISVQVTIMWHYADSIQQVYRFVDGKPVSSGDALYDEAVRMKFAYYSRLGVMVMMVSAILNQFFWFFVPHSVQVRLYPCPMDRYLNDASPLRPFFCIFKHFLPMIWSCKYFWPFTKLLVLLLGLQAEQKILAHRLENDMLRMQSRISLNHDQQALDEFWKQLRSDMGQTVEQHFELIRNFELLQSPISKIFFLFYYNAFLTYGSLVFIMLDDPMSVVPLICATSISLALGYCMCRMVDSFKDTNETIHEKVYEMCAKLPFDKQHCSEYRQMRSTLMIIALYTANSGNVNSGGTVDITMTTFANVLDTSYSMLTFLLGMRQS